MITFDPKGIFQYVTLVATTLLCLLNMTFTMSTCVWSSPPWSSPLPLHPCPSHSPRLNFRVGGLVPLFKNCKYLNSLLLATSFHVPYHDDNKFRGCYWVVGVCMVLTNAGQYYNFHRCKTSFLNLRNTFAVTYIVVRKLVIFWGKFWIWCGGLRRWRGV